VADLSAVRMSNVLFVTTAERAEKLRPSADSPTQPAGGAVFPFPNGGGAVPFKPPVIGGRAAFRYCRPPRRSRPSPARTARAPPAPPAAPPPAPNGR
jgi:hypothetical protein